MTSTCRRWSRRYFCRFFRHAGSRHTGTNSRGQNRPAGTDSVDIFGYINCLKECDASVQWAPLCPPPLERQQRGFKVERFEYKNARHGFIGFEGDEYSSVEKRMEKCRYSAPLTEYQTELACDVFFMHHYGLGGMSAHGMVFGGRFMKADTPVPEGFLSIDFVPFREVKKAGPPYISQFCICHLLRGQRGHAPKRGIRQRRHVRHQKFHAGPR